MNVFAWNLFNCFFQVSVFYILYSVYGYKISPEETLPLCHVCLATWSLVTDCRNAHRLQQLDMQPYWLLFRDMYQLWCVASDMPSFFLVKYFLEFKTCIREATRICFLADTLYIWTRKVGSLEAAWENEGNGNQWTKHRRKRGWISMSISCADNVQPSKLRKKNLQYKVV